MAQIVLERFVIRDGCAALAGRLIIGFLNLNAKLHALGHFVLNGRRRSLIFRMFFFNKAITTSSTARDISPSVRFSVIEGGLYGIGVLPVRPDQKRPIRGANLWTISAPWMGRALARVSYRSHRE